MGLRSIVGCLIGCLIAGVVTMSVIPVWVALGLACVTALAIMRYDAAAYRSERAKGNGKVSP